MNPGYGVCGGCGDGETAAVSGSNPPGLAALACRVDTYAGFRESMLASLSRHPGMTGLTTRRDDDFTVALLDAWAVILDVLSFYQERIANEGYLQTAVERRSILELARSIGYELNPGVAAGVHLAFTVDDLEGSPRSVRIAAGSSVQSVPGQDELPQIFETSEELEARVELNGLRPRLRKVRLPAAGNTVLYFKGTAANLRAGDAVLVEGEEQVSKDVREEPGRSGRLDVNRPGPDRPGPNDPEGRLWDLRRVRSVRMVSGPAPGDDGYTEATLDAPLGAISTSRGGTAPNAKAYVLRQRAALFGFNAPDFRVMPDAVKEAFGGKASDTEWPSFNIAYGAKAPQTLSSLHLDAVYPRVAPGTRLVVSIPDRRELYTVQEVAEEAKADFGMTAKTTRVVLDGPDLVPGFFDELRRIVVFAESETLDWAEVPMTDSVKGSAVTLDSNAGALTEGHLFIAAGRDAVTGEERAEVLSLRRAVPDGAATRLEFWLPLSYAYSRETMVLYGNVVRATHGESGTEIAGSGDGGKSFQEFVLKRSPVTRVSAATPSGAQSTLEVRVNDILWSEVPSLLGRSASEKVYVSRTDDDGTVRFAFGDGRTGARIPTGSENVSASYRCGIGTGGLVDAHRITLLMSRPLGLKGVTNPLPSSGAADPEDVASSRKNAPKTVLTMDRIVSVQDYQNFAQAFAGVGKAQAALLWAGSARRVHLTVAGTGGAAVAASSDLHRNLTAAIDAARHPALPVAVDSYRPKVFRVEAGVLVDPAFIAADVLGAASAALIAAFSFDSRAFGQPVRKSEVLAVIQDVAGVAAVDLDALYVSGEPRSLSTVLACAAASAAGTAVAPAELLTVDPGGISLKEAAL